MAEPALRIYDHDDDSGAAHRPYPGSSVEPRNRIDYRSYQTITQLLTGSGFQSFWARYERNVTKRLLQQQHRLSGDEWEYHADLMTLFETEVAAAAMDALCGEYLLQRSPHFLADLWTLDRRLDKLIRATPRIFAPRTYAMRDRLLAAVRDWQGFARARFRPSCVDPETSDDPFWGSRFFRLRQEVFLEMDGMDYDAIASEDFGAIWAYVFVLSTDFIR